MSISPTKWTKLGALQYNPIIWFALMKHLGWAIGIGFIDGDTYKINALYILSSIGKPAIIILLIIASIAAIVAMFDTTLSDFDRTFLLWPQQAIMWSTAISIVMLAFSGHFADGIEKPGIFIFSDQIGYVVGAIAHTTTMIVYSWRGKWSLKT